MEHTVKLGDLCPDCQQLGQTKRIRYFYINLEEQILKCESNNCLYPHNDEISSDSAESSPPQSPHYTELQPDDGATLLEELLNHTDTTTAAATIDTASAPSMPIISFDLLDEQAPLPTSAPQQPSLTSTTKPPCIKTEKVESVSKPKIEIQSIKTIHITEDINVKTELQSAQQQPIEDDIPKARISRYFETIKANANTKSIKVEPAAKVRKKPKKPKPKKQEEPTKPNTQFDEILKLIKK